MRILCYLIERKSRENGNLMGWYASLKEGGWVDNPNHATRFKTAQLARLISHDWGWPYVEAVEHIFFTREEQT